MVLLIVGGVVWGMYDSGVFDRSGAGSSTTQVFGTQESGRLVERLDAAAKAQHVCYGWEIDSGRFSFSAPRTPLIPETSPTGGAAPVPKVPPRPGVQVGSNLGANVDARQSPQQCPRWFVFVADYTYSNADEEWTSVTQSIKTNTAVTVTPTDIAQAGISAQDLLGDNANARLADAIESLPLIVAEKGGAAPVPPAAELAPPAGDKPSAPGNGRYVWMGIAGALILGGLVWIIVAAVRGRRGISQ